jgi:LPXTG-site transpeptidase (sortase) family protein
MSLRRNSWFWIACVVGIRILIYFISNTSDNLTTHVTATTEAGIPLHLIIPSISVDAPIEQVGLTATGAMDAPKDPQTVGWLGTSAIPGLPGNAVIDGHRGWYKKPAVFDRLHEMQVGDRIYVKDEKESIIVFIVREIKNYDPKDDTSEVFNSSTTGVHLNLITCSGDWSIDEQDYSKRLVVFAERE